MLRPDLLDAIDVRLRKARQNPAPFGGAQVLLVGDPLQLPPIVRDSERELLHGLGYRTPFLHSARVWREVGDLRSVELTRVYRQSEPEFIAALNEIRRGRNVGAAVRFLNDACLRPHRQDRSPVVLTPTRAQADRYNRRGLVALDGPETVYRGRISGRLNIQRENLPAPQELPLRVAAEVMAVNNDAAGRWVNGSRGQVVELEPEAAVVRFHGSGQTHKMSRHAWEKVRQSWDSVAGRIRNEVEGTTNCRSSWTGSIKEPQHDPRAEPTPRPTDGG